MHAYGSVDGLNFSVYPNESQIPKSDTWILFHLTEHWSFTRRSALPKFFYHAAPTRKHEPNV
jgi:hypothetical protein